MIDVNSEQVNDNTKEMHKYIWFQILKIYGFKVKSEMRMLKIRMANSSLKSLGLNTRYFLGSAAI